MGEQFGDTLSNFGWKMLTSLYSSTYIKAGFKLEEDNRSVDTESDVVNNGERNSISVFFTITSVGGSTTNPCTLHCRSRPTLTF